MLFARYRQQTYLGLPHADKEKALVGRVDKSMKSLSKHGRTACGTIGNHFEDKASKVASKSSPDGESG